VSAITNSFPVRIYRHYCKTGQNNYFGNEINSEVKTDEDIRRRMQKSSEFSIIKQILWNVAVLKTVQNNAILK
jgi:hypothetical protein